MKEFVSSNELEGTLAALGELWTMIDECPAVDELPQDTRAEVFAHRSVIS